MEDILISINKLNRIKRDIGNLKGKPVRIKTKIYRGKAKVYEGIISGVYSSYFNIQLEQPYNRQVGFHFSDILTEDITLKEL